MVESLALVVRRVYELQEFPGSTALAPVFAILRVVQG
jgi:hypothetical protein